jgi:hypothetical protein
LTSRPHGGVLHANNAPLILAFVTGLFRETSEMFVRETIINSAKPQLLRRLSADHLG